MLRYDWGIIFKKCWVWYADPFEVPGVAMANFFSYHQSDIPGFRAKKGLTTVIGLEADLDEIWNRLRKGFIRKQIARGERNGIEIRPNRDFKAFRRVYQSFRQAKGLGKDRLKPVLENGRQYLAYYLDKLLAGGLFIEDEKYSRAWALSSFRFGQDGRLREIVGQANRLLIWEAIKDARVRGLKQLDLGGISPDAANPELRSLSEFKEAFGGARQDCYYYHKIYSPALKALIKLKEIIKR